MCLLQFFRLKSDFLKKSSKVDSWPQLSNKLLAPAHLGWPDPKIHVVGPPNYFPKNPFFGTFGPIGGILDHFLHKKNLRFFDQKLAIWGIAREGCGLYPIFKKNWDFRKIARGWSIWGKVEPTTRNTRSWNSENAGKWVILAIFGQIAIFGLQNRHFPHLTKKWKSRKLRFHEVQFSAILRAFWLKLYMEGILVIITICVKA